MRQTRFQARSYVPAYRRLGGAELRRRAAQAAEMLAACRVCPRNCGVDRRAGQTGTCRIGRTAYVASAFRHFGEEDCLRGTRGSGTIFFSGCNLRCVFCQNDEISHCVAGRAYEAADIGELMLTLQDEGCHNINFVTPTHVLPQMLEAVAAAAEHGLNLPIVYNTSAYDSLAGLALLDGVIDVYMPDFKFWSPQQGERYLAAPDYGERAREAIAAMHRQVGELRFGPDGTACRGLLVRHLVMPGLLRESEAIFKWLAENVSRDTFVNVMGQYRPSNLVGRRATVPAGEVRAGAAAAAGCGFPEIDRPISAGEMREAYRLARAAGLWRFD